MEHGSMWSNGIGDRKRSVKAFTAEKEQQDSPVERKSYKVF